MDIWGFSKSTDVEVTLRQHFDLLTIRTGKTCIYGC